MNFGFKFVLLATVCSIGCTSFTYDVFAKNGSTSSSSSSSSSSSRPSTPSYSKPSTPAPSVTPSVPKSAIPTPNSYGKPSAPNQAAPIPATNTVPSVPAVKPTVQNPTVDHSSPYGKPSVQTNSTTPGPTVQRPATIAPSALASSSNKAMSANSFSAYKAERDKSTKPPHEINPSEAKNNPASTQYKTPDHYMASRTTIVNNYQAAYPGVYSISYGLHPNYGIYDSSFLTGMVIGAFGTALLDRATWMYSHQNDPWYHTYRADLNQQAVNNAELRTKLAEIDAKMAELKAQNAQMSRTLPSGIDSAYAVAPEAVIANANNTPDPIAQTESGTSWGLIVFLGICFTGVGIFLGTRFFR